ncbi:MAG: hypothetical protein COB66_07590 [Coxiella sp. (in: Bacteria)]|nr:MAG: hypothetical protein COB66_07590 [Coxiella sp. (in: g-proteobacteria)]
MRFECSIFVESRGYCNRDFILAILLVANKKCKQFDGYIWTVKPGLKMISSTFGNGMCLLKNWPRKWKLA